MPRPLRCPHHLLALPLHLACLHLLMLPLPPLVLQSTQGVALLARDPIRAPEPVLQVELQIQHPIQQSSGRGEGSDSIQNGNGAVGTAIQFDRRRSAGSAVSSVQRESFIRRPGVGAFPHHPALGTGNGRGERAVAGLVLAPLADRVTAQLPVGEQAERDGGRPFVRR